MSLLAAGSAEPLKLGCVSGVRVKSIRTQHEFAAQDWWKTIHFERGEMICRKSYLQRMDLAEGHLDAERN